MTSDQALVPGVDPVTTTVCGAEGGLTVAAGFTLDLGGATIRGQHLVNGLCAGTGITLNNGSTVVGGRLVGFDVAIEGAQGSTVSLVQVFDSCSTGIHFQGSDNTIERNIVRRTGGAAIHVDGDDNAVNVNRVEVNGRGIVASGERNDLVRNIVYRSVEVGIAVDGADATLDRNQAKYTSGGDGFTFSGAGHAALRNISASNMGDGFAVSATACTFSLNSSKYNKGWGIRDSTPGGGTDNTYSRNVCTGNTLGDSSPPGLCS